MNQQKTKTKTTYIIEIQIANMKSKNVCKNVLARARSKKTYFNSSINKRKINTHRLIRNVNKDSARKRYESKKDVRDNVRNVQKKRFFFLLSPLLLQINRIVFQKRPTKYYLCAFILVVCKISTIFIPSEN